MAALHELTIAEAAAQIRARELSPVELTGAVLARIDEVEPRITAFATVLADAATSAAEHAANEIARGEYRGPLHGIPIGLKDLFETAGVPTTASSEVRADYVPQSNSAVTDSLMRAGAILVGMTHTHEFAYGATTPTTRNPWDLSRTAGGSSGGSAAAVASGEIFMGMGTDTAGSIRIPSAVTGTVGIKPTYGRVSRHGLTPLSWSLDHAGPLTRTVEDAAIVLNHIAGYDRRDRATVDAEVPDYTSGLKAGVDGLRIGVPSNYFTHNVDPEVSATASEAIDVLERNGATTHEVEIPMADSIMPALWGIMVPEASAYHQRMLRESADLYTDEVRTFLEAGELIPATDYIKALRARALIQDSVREMFSGIDVLATPTVTCPALPKENLTVAWPDGSSEGATLTYVRYPTLGDLTGLPAISVPAGLTAESLPVGLQIMGRPFDEPTVFRAGHAYQSAVSWPQLAPL